MIYSLKNADILRLRMNQLKCFPSERLPADATWHKAVEVDGAFGTGGDDPVCVLSFNDDKYIIRKSTLNNIKSEKNVQI